jgi:hypothetical protein
MGFGLGPAGRVPDRKVSEGSDLSGEAGGVMGGGAGGGNSTRRIKPWVWEFGQWEVLKVLR